LGRQQGVHIQEALQADKGGNVDADGNQRGVKELLGVCLNQGRTLLEMKRAIQGVRKKGHGDGQGGMDGIAEPGTGLGGTQKPGVGDVWNACLIQFGDEVREGFRGRIIQIG